MSYHRFTKKVFALGLTLAMLLQVIPVFAETVTPDATFRFYMVGNAHIDTAWRWPIQHTAEEIIRDTFSRQIDALKGDSTYKFTASCSTHYKWTKEYYPEMYEDIKELYDAGQWGIAGGQYVEPDLNVMEGENFARQGLYAQHFFLDEFGDIATAGLVPDVFGFSGQFPQFLRKTGMSSYVATKLNWSSDPGDGALDPGPWNQSSNGNDSKGRESDIFWWESIDGSDVLAYNCREDYTSSYSVGAIRNSSNSVFNSISKSGSFTNTTGSNTNGSTAYTGTFYYDYDSNIKYALGMFGEGDHGAGPRSGTGSNNHGWPAANSGGTNGPTVIPATLDEYFEDVRKPGVGTAGNADGANRVASRMSSEETSLDRVYRHVGENYLSYHRGTYTSWSRVKKYNRQINNLSQTAEQAATLGFWTNSLANNSNEKIELSWERLSINTMHDILPGSSAPIQYYQTFMNGELCNNLLVNVQNNALIALAHRANTVVDEGVPVFVYNPSSWQRDDETETTVTLDQKYPYIKVFDGTTEMPVTVIENDSDGVAKINFIAKEVPSLGYKVFKVVGSETPSALSEDVRIVTDDASSIVVENDNLKFTLSKTTGNMPSLINKKDNNREAFYPTSTFQGNALQFKTDTGGNSFPAWDMTNSEFGGLSQNWTTVNSLSEEPEIVVNTPEKITIKVVHEMTDSANTTPSTATRYITLLAGSDKIDVRFELDWQMQQRNLKVAFPVNVDARAASYEIAYGALDGATEVERMDTVVPETSASQPLMSNSLSGVPSYAGALGRATIRDTRWNAARFEHSGHKWMDVTADSKSNGLSILNDAKYGFDVLKMVRSGSTASGIGSDSGIPQGSDDTYVRARMTVVRSPQSANNDYQRANQVANPTSHRIDIGEQDFNYSIYPHAGTWQDGKTAVKAHELNFPMQSFQAVAGAGDGILGTEESFFSLNKDNVIIGAVKNQHDEQTNKNKIIVRVWETNGSDTEGVVLNLPSNVIAVREVNMLEHDYNELSDDNIDSPISKALVAKKITSAGNTVSFDIDHYEILTMEIEIAPYAGTQLTLDQEKIDLSGYFNTRGTSPDSDRQAGNLDDNGNTIPEPLWKEAREADVDYQGIKFQLGPDADSNFVTAGGQSIPVSATGYSRVYLLGVAGKNAAAGGKFTVNYTDGGSASKQIMFADWRSPLTGWVPMDRMDTKPYVYDSIAQVFTHWHDPTMDMMTFDNYLYVYYIDIDETKTISNITLPDASGAKIAAISLVESEAKGFGGTNETSNFVGGKELYWDFSDLEVGSEPGTSIDKLHIEGAEEPVGYRNFQSVFSAGITGTSSGEVVTNILKNDASTKVCGNINQDTNTFIMDAGEKVSYGNYILRGGNDDSNYASRRLNTWIVEASNSPSGPWTTISSPGSSPGFTTNYETRMFAFDSMPEEGYRYYKLQITRTGEGAGSHVGTGNILIQFSYFGLVAGTQQNGNLKTEVVDNSPIQEEGILTVDSLNGPNVVTFSGRVATDVTAPANAKSYTTLRKNASVMVYPDTKLGYMFKPVDSGSAYMSLDLKFADEGRLKDTIAVDQNGIAVNPKAQGAGNALVPAQWNYVEIDLGEYASGRIIDEIIIGYETEDGSPGQEIEGSFDNVSIFRGDSDFGDVEIGSAVYQADGKMLDANTSDPLSLHAFSTVAIPTPIVVDMKNAGPNGFAKLFVWDADNYAPVTDANRFELIAGMSDSTAENAEIIYSAVDESNTEFEAIYDYYHAEGVDEGETQFEWFKNVGGQYFPILNETGKTITLANEDVLEMDGIRCEITVFDINWNRGTAVNADLVTRSEALLGANVVYQTTANDSASNMFDNNLTTKWDAPTEESYGGYQGPLPHIAIFEVPDGITNISQIQLWHANSNPDAQDYDRDARIATYDFDVSYSSDNETWTSEEDLNWETIEIRENTDPITIIDLNGSVPVRYIRLTVHTPNAGGEDWDTNYKSIRILEFKATTSVIFDN